MSRFLWFTVYKRHCTQCAMDSVGTEYTVTVAAHQTQASSLEEFPSPCSPTTVNFNFHFTARIQIKYNNFVKCLYTLGELVDTHNTTSAMHQCEVHYSMYKLTAVTTMEYCTATAYSMITNRLIFVNYMKQLTLDI